MCAQLPWHAPSQAEFGFPFWSSNEREIRAWRLSREHAQLRRLSEEQRKGAAGGKRKVKQLVRDEGAAALEAPLCPESLEDSVVPARALEASFATCPSVDGRELTAAAGAVDPTDPDASGLSSGPSQTGLNPPAAPPSLHNRSLSLRSSWITAPAVASAQAQAPHDAPHDAPAKRKAVATPSRASRQRGPARSIAPAVGTESASDAAAEPTAAALTAEVEPVSTQPADVVRPSELPDGWLCTVHQRSATNRAQYKRYEGPNGERAQSLKQAWAMHEQAASSAVAAVAKSDGPEEPDALAELVEEDGEEVEDQPVEDCIPEGYERSKWEPGHPVRWFMLWQPAVTPSDVQWRFGEAVRPLPWNKRFTHDAWLQGMASGQILGVDLAPCHHAVGSWVMLRKKA